MQKQNEEGSFPLSDNSLASAESLPPFPLLREPPRLRQGQAAHSPGSTTLMDLSLSPFTVSIGGHGLGKYLRGCGRTSGRWRESNGACCLPGLGVSFLCLQPHQRLHVFFGEGDRGGVFVAGLVPQNVKLLLDQLAAGGMEIRPGLSCLPERELCHLKWLRGSALNHKIPGSNCTSSGSLLGSLRQAALAFPSQRKDGWG